MTLPINSCMRSFQALTALDDMGKTMPKIFVVDLVTFLCQKATTSISKCNTKLDSESDAWQKFQFNL